MKKFWKFGLAGLGMFVMCGLGIGLTQIAKEQPVMVLAEEAPEEESVEVATVVIEKTSHGEISTSITEGEVGQVCVITAKADIFYKVESISVNGTVLIESETTRGEYSFTLGAGENKIASSFIIDAELCGEFSKIAEEISNKDWKNLFSVENICTIVKWVLDGGVLIALVRYYIKDKKLEAKLEAKVKSTIENIIPETTKQTVIAAIETSIKPIFADLVANDVETKKAMTVFAKCMALSQENTPESRRAILDELSALNISDANTIESIKKYIEDLVTKHNKMYEETLAKIEQIGEHNKTIVESPVENEKESQVNKEENTYDGTSI